MRLLRGVDPERGHTVRPPGDPRRRGVDAGGLPSGGQGDQRRGRRGIGEQAVERVGQAERLAQPVDDDLLELGAGGEVRHSIGFWSSAAISISPRIPGPDAVEAK